MFSIIIFNTSCKLALTGGGIRVVQGGRFELGFLSGFASSVGASVAGLIKEPNIAALAGIGAITGGTAEALGGGKFANGAVTGAFVALFNHGQNHSKSSKKGKLNVKEFDNKEDAYNCAWNLQKSGKEYAGFEFTHTETGEIVYVVDIDSPVDHTNCEWRPAVRAKYEGLGYDISGLFHTHPVDGIQFGNTVDLRAMNNLGANYQVVVTEKMIYRYDDSYLHQRVGNYIDEQTLKIEYVLKPNIIKKR